MHFRANKKSADTVAVFDNTFDRTFIELYPSGVDEEYEILESSSTEGVYIRWIDIYGERHYYLFDENDCSIIVETSDYRLKNSNGELGERSFVNKVCTQLKCSAENIFLIRSPSTSNFIQCHYIIMIFISVCVKVFFGIIGALKFGVGFICFYEYLQIFWAVCCKFGGTANA